jgi:cytochrome c-type biogenesis protein
LDFTITKLVLLPVGLGLLGFIEPCSIGSTLLFVKYLQAEPATNILAQASLFATTRALFIGLLGVVAVVVGEAFLGFQRAAWITLGTVYILLGVAYALGKTRSLRVSLGPNLAHVPGLRSSAIIGVVFGLNVPACATPLIFALLASAAASGAGGATLLSGFVSLGLFGLALSAPLLAILLLPGSRHALNALASLSQRVPVWAGLILVALGVWSIWIAAFSELQPS